MKQLALWFILVLFLHSLSAFSYSRGSVSLVRREDGCYDNIYCSPHADEMWIMNGTTYMARWNAEYPPFQSKNILTALIDVGNPTGFLELKKYANSQGFAPFLLSDLDFGGPNDKDAYKERKVRFAIYPDATEPSILGPIFTIIQPGKNGALPPVSKPSPTASTQTLRVTATVTPTPTPVQSASKMPSKTAIILISVGSGVALVVVALAVMLLRRRRRMKTAAAEANAQMPKRPSMDSTTPLAGPRPLSNVDGSSVRSDTPGTSHGISPNEAIIIAQTYRQLMRKPSWGNSRERLSDDGMSKAHQVIQQELEKEGRGLNTVSNGSVVQVVEENSGKEAPHEV